MGKDSMSIHGLSAFFFTITDRKWSPKITGDFHGPYYDLRNCQIAHITHVNFKIQARLYICILNIHIELSDITTTNTVAIGLAGDWNTLFKSSTAFLLI